MISPYSSIVNPLLFSFQIANSEHLAQLRISTRWKLCEAVHAYQQPDIGIHR
jgi:hypothetical protein